MRPRGRKKELKGDARRRELLNALRRLLADGQDFGELNVAALAKAADMSRPTFYFYFESKYEALGAVVAEVRSELIEGAEILFSGRHEDPFAELQQALQGVVETWQKEAGLMQAFAQAASNDPGLWQQMESFVEDFVEPTGRSIVAIHEQQGRTTDLETARQLARTLLWGNERNLYRAAVGHYSPEQWAELLQTLTAIWAGAVLYQPEASS